MSYDDLINICNTLLFQVMDQMKYTDIPESLIERKINIELVLLLIDGFKNLDYCPMLHDYCSSEVRKLI